MLALTKDTYVLYPDYSATGKTSVGLSPLRLATNENFTEKLLKDKWSKARLEPQSNDHSKKQQLPVTKELTNN
jgi:hypothetical protein